MESRIGTAFAWELHSLDSYLIPDLVPRDFLVWFFEAFRKTMFFKHIVWLSPGFSQAIGVLSSSAQT